MSRKATLEAAIQRAIDNGWQYDGRHPIEYFSVPGDGEWIYFGYEDTKYPDLSLNDLIFRHDFAKALWGDKPIPTKFGRDHPDEPYTATEHLPMFKLHLQKMVIAEDPIKYLGDHL